MKAVVLEVGKRGRAVVLTEDGGFVRCTLPSATEVGQEVELPAPVRPSLRPAWRVAAATALAAALLVAGLRLTPQAMADTVAYVAVDIEPSLRLGVAADGTVTQVLASDPVSRRLAGRADVRGLPLDRAVADVVAAAERAGYLGHGRGAVVLTAYPAQGKTLIPAVRRALRSAAAAAGHLLHGRRQVLSLLAPPAVVAGAARSHVSPGRYALFVILRAHNRKVSLADLARASDLTKAVDEVESLVEPDQQGAGGGSGGSSPPGSGTTGEGQGRHEQGGGNTPAPGSEGDQGGGPSVVILPGDSGEGSVSVPVDIPGVLPGDQGQGDQGDQGGGSGTGVPGVTSPPEAPHGDHGRHTGGDGSGDGGSSSGPGSEAGTARDQGRESGDHGGGGDRWGRDSGSVAPGSGFGDHGGGGDGGGQGTSPGDGGSGGGQSGD